MGGGVGGERRENNDQTHLDALHNRGERETERERERQSERDRERETE